MSAANDNHKLRAWLEYIAQTAIDLLDDLDASEIDRECDEAEALRTREEGWR